MKIAMLGHKVVPSRRGGIERVLTALCPVMAEKGLDITLYNRSTDLVEGEYKDAVSDGKYKGIKLKKAFSLKSRGISAMMASFTGAICVALGKYDIVHFHAEGPCAAMWLVKMFGKKCVATVHGLDWQREKWGKGFASKYIKFGEKVMVKYADEIIVLSESAKKYFKDTYGRKTVVIHNGIEKPVLKEAFEITKRYGIEKNGYIAIVSRLTAEKGIHYLIEAYNNIKTDKKLVIAGDTSDTDEYVKMLQNMAAGNENIIFTGFISGDVLCEIYSNAYAICLPSDIEGMSLSLLEALSYKNAVLCSDISENASVAEDKAMYFEKGNVADLTEKLQYLCDNKDVAEEYKEHSDEFVLNKYKWSDIADETAKLYEKVLSGKEGKSYEPENKRETISR